MIVGYARVSTQEQNLQMQMDELQKFGCFEIFEEKITGTKRDRPALNEMIKMLREGDRVVVYKLDRISRSTKHLIELTELFEEKGVEFGEGEQPLYQSVFEFINVQTSSPDVKQNSPIKP
ncbi:recombinase family protein, partial [Peribacillus butanolivorans]